ncbi:phytase [Neiella marina]|uniref:Phytase n=1 Tax=Neiella holothuriorum TaxID=2870530 RepID=A0ABS7EHP1_9GAMM|nr:phytase [Neiella holothuriorum]MBW8191863.1 phytase [Neiella holothuriorum]
MFSISRIFVTSAEALAPQQWSTSKRVVQLTRWLSFSAVAGAALLTGCGAEQSQTLELNKQSESAWFNVSSRLVATRNLAEINWQVSLINDGRAMQIVSQSGDSTSTTRTVPFSDMLADDFCLYLSPQSQNLYAFVQDGRARSEQWLLAEQGRTLADPVKVRQLPVGYDTSRCAANDATGELFIAEEGVGVWRYQAEPEAMTDRQPVAMNQPWGNLTDAVEDLAVLADGRLALLLPTELHLLTPTKQGFGLSQHWPLTTDSEQEFELLGTRLQADQQHIELAFGHEDESASWHVQLPFDAEAHATHLTKAMPLISEVKASYQTPPAKQTGDAMDDPAIWLNPLRPAMSLVLGTHKKHGLYVYDLQGRKLQVLADGMLNNVDVRSFAEPIGDYYGLAVASRRDDNTVLLYGINAERQVTQLARFDTPLNKIYGICMGQLDDQLVMFPNDKDGRVLHYQLNANDDGQQWQASLVQTLTLDSQPEGCVVDDVRQQLFVGEEDVGIWMAQLNESNPQWQAIATIDEHLHADVEGIAIARGEPDILVASSQGNDSYVLFQAVFPYQYLGRFRVGLNAAKGLDGSSETDGLDVLTTPLNTDFPAGLLVVQDGRNLMPDQAQNFKLVSWTEVLTSLQPVPE